MKWWKRYKFVRKVRDMLKDRARRNRWKVALTEAAKNHEGLEDLWALVDEADRLW